MNKLKLLSALMLIPSVVIASDLDQQQRDDICRLMIDDHRLVSNPIKRKSSIKIEGQKPRHVIEDVENIFEGNEGKYLHCAASTDSTVWSVISSCITSLFSTPNNEYNFHRTNLAAPYVSYISYGDIRNMYKVDNDETNRTKRTTFTQRGVYAVGMLQKSGSSPHFCDESVVYSQSHPTIGLNTLASYSPTNQPIYAKVNYSYDDNYSKAAIQNTQPTFTWTFKNIDYSGVQETQTTTTPYISFGPEYGGEYKVTARINDGTFSASVILGYTLYSTSGNNCPPSSGSNCQQPF